MSFFRVFGRTQALHSFNTTLQHHSSTSRNYLQIIAPRYSLFSVGNNGRWKVSSFGCGSLMPRCEFRAVVDSNIPFSNLGRHSIARSCSMLNFQHQYATKADFTEKKSKKMLLYLTGLVFVMVGCSYAAVPLYRRFCQATGYGGTVQRKESVEDKIARHSKDGTVSTREIVVQFNADVADGMPWKFIPTQREVRVKPGESALAFYTAENRSSTPITGVSTYNVTPMKAAVYFNKIQCFCFEEQRLLPGEQIDMPVFFYIDPEFETDPKMDGINNLILSYTFFKVSDE